MPPSEHILPIVSARALSSFGRAIISTTVLWELYQRTDDTLVIAAVGLVQVLPVVLLFTWSGGLVDRSDRRTLTTICAAGAGAVGLGLAIASWVEAPPAVYLVILLAQGCFTSVMSPASSSLIPLIIERDQLERTNRIASSLQELATIAGPSLSGLAVYKIAPSYVYAFVAVTGLASATLYRALPKPRATGGGNARKDWRVGLRFIFRSPLLLPALTLDMFAVLFAGVTALLPAIADNVLHTNSLGYGFLRAAQAAGAMSMAVLGGRLPPWKRPGRVLLIVVALFGLATVGFGLSRSLPLSIVLLFVCGALDNVSVVIRLTLEQMVVPDSIRGRVSAVHFVFIGMSNELGAAESGAAAWAIGIVPSIVAGGAVAVAVVGFVAVRWRALATMPPLSELKPSAEDGTVVDVAQP